MAILIRGQMRRFQPVKAAKADDEIRMTGLESLAVDQVAPLGWEMTRAGRRVHLGNNAAITGIAPVQALPTVTPQWAIWNTDSNKTIVFKTLGVYCTSGSPGVGGILLAALFQTPAITGASTVGIGLSSASGTGVAVAGSGAVVKSAPGNITTPAAPNWIAIAENTSPNVGAFPGSGTIVNRGIEGRLAIQPNWGLALVVLALAGTTPLFAPFGEWVAIESDPE